MQEKILNEMKNLISYIRSTRVAIGKDPENHAETFNKVDSLYNKLTDENKYVFDNFIVN
jgi:hypothetical protein